MELNFVSNWPQDVQVRTWRPPGPTSGSPVPKHLKPTKSRPRPAPASRGRRWSGRHCNWDWSIAPSRFHRAGRLSKSHRPAQLRRDRTSSNSARCSLRHRRSAGSLFRVDFFQCIVWKVCFISIPRLMLRLCLFSKINIVKFGLNLESTCVYHFQW